MKQQPVRTSRLIILVLLFVGMCACKKGEDDPAFTLSSRTSRMAGDWKMKKAQLTLGIKDSAGTYGNFIYTFNESKVNIVNTSKGSQLEHNSTLTISFTKDGGFTLKQMIDKEKFEATGVWDFQGGVGDYKNKERITMRLETIKGNTGWYDLFNKSVTSFTYRIKELRSKRLVLVTEKEMISLNSKNVGVYVTSEYVFE